MSRVDVLVPDSIDDTTRPSGGNVYNRRLCDGLRAEGWHVQEHLVAGSWPWPDALARRTLADVIASLPDGTLALIDGLIASTAPDILVPAKSRIRPVALIHMPLGVPATGVPERQLQRREGAVLRACSAVIVTSRWTRDRLIGLYLLPPGATHVVEPGGDMAAPACRSTGGHRLLCVGAVAPHKGHDRLISALATVAGLPWQLRCAGSLDHDPEFVAELTSFVASAGITDRVKFGGAVTGRDLQRWYHDTDLLLLASRFESYGMVVTEALAHGVPVIATRVGGIPEALGHATGGRRPGLLVPPEDGAALAEAVRRWLTDQAFRRRLRGAALDRRKSLRNWPEVARAVGRALYEVSA